MTEALLHFEDRPPAVPAGSACAACGTGKMLGHDHCHEHGWVRGIVCMGCNAYLGVIDRRLEPGVTGEHLAALLAVRNRCPECPPLTAADLERRGRRARENRLRKMADRQGCKLTISRRGTHATDPGIYTLTQMGAEPEIFESAEDAIEFLGRRELTSSSPCEA